MNVTKVSLPSSFLLNFYYYFSYFTLLITWLITPILFYIILTQSKQLRYLKWFILYSSFWCLIFQTVLSINKFIILTPSMSTYSIGIIGINGSYDKTFYANLLAVICIVNYSVALALALCVRYLLAFPSSLIGWFNLKSMIGISVAFTFGLFVLITYAIIFKSDPAEIHLEAISYDEFFSTFTDQSLLYFSYNFGRPVGIAFFTTLSCLIFFTLTLMTYFIFIVYSTKTKTVTQIQHYLIINSIAEVSLLCLFLILPATIFVGFVIFQIPNSAGFTVICISFIHLYSPINFGASLYFIAPYRRFLTKQLAEIAGITTAAQMKAVNITPVETSIRRNN